MARRQVSGEPGVATSRASRQPERPASSASLKRIKATFVDHVLWTQFNLKLLWEGKTLQDWVQEQISELNKVPLSSIRPIPQADRVKLSPSQLERKHWVPVRVDPNEYLKARWRWSAMGVSMTEWFYNRIRDYCGGVDLDAIEQAITSGEGNLPAEQTTGRSGQTAKTRS